MARRIVDLPPARAGVALSAADAAANERGGQPFWKEFFIYSADFTGAAALPAGALNADPVAVPFASFPIRIHSDSDFEWIKTLYTFTDPRVYARLQDDSSGRRLHRSTLDLRLAAGQGVNFAALVANIESTAFLPFIEPAPYTIAAASVFTVDAADFSAALNTVRISFHGNKVRPGFAPWEVDEAGQGRLYRARAPFKLVLPPDGTTMTVPANQTVNYSAPMDMEGDFLVHRITGLHTGAALIQLQDGSGRDRLWQDRAVDFALMCGTGIFPMILPAPRFVYRGSSVQAIVRDTSGAANRLKIILHGEKLYAAA